MLIVVVGSTTYNHNHIYEHAVQSLLMRFLLVYGLGVIPKPNKGYLTPLPM